MSLDRPKRIPSKMDSHSRIRSTSIKVKVIMAPNGWVVNPKY